MHPIFHFGRHWPNEMTIVVAVVAEVVTAIAYVIDVVVTVAMGIERFRFRSAAWRILERKFRIVLARGVLLADILQIVNQFIQFDIVISMVGHSVDYWQRNNKISKRKKERKKEKMPTDFL